MDNILLNNVLDYRAQIWKDDTRGYDYYHAIRVYHVATEICEIEQGDMETVQFAALLHDVDQFERKNGKKHCYDNTIHFLKENNIKRQQIDCICKVIADASLTNHEKIPSTLEGKIVKDADRLDTIGAVGIARVFTHGGSINRQIHSTELQPCSDNEIGTYRKENDTSIDWINNKLLLVQESMNTETGKEIALHRHLFMKLYLSEFHAEWEGTL